MIERTIYGATRMGILERTIGRAGRRAAIDLALLGAGRGIVVGAVGGLCVLGLDRVGSWPIPIEAYPMVVAAAALCGVVLAVLRRPTGFDMAVRLDRRLGLDDRLGTGVMIRDGRVAGEMAGLADLDARRVAGTIDVGPVTPIRVTRIWAPAILLTAGLAVGVAFVPTLAQDATDDPAASRRQQRDEQRTQIVQAIDDTLGDLDDDTLDSASRQDVDMLQDLAEQLSGPTPSERELARIRDQSAAHMQEMADRLAEDAQRNLDVVEEVTRQFVGAAEPAPAPAREPPPGLDEFLDAMRRGDLGEAAEQFDDLMEAQREFAPSTREDLARELRELSERLDSPPENGTDPDELERFDRLREALDDLGVDEQTLQEILEQRDPAEAAKALEEALDEAADELPDGRQFDPETRRRLTEDLQQERKQRQTEREAEEQRKRLAEALDKAADEADPAPQQQQDQPRQTPQQEPAATGDEPPKINERPSADESPTPDETRKPSEQGEPAAREVPQGTPDATQVPRPGQDPDPGPGPAPGADENPPSVSDVLRELQDVQRQSDGKQADSRRLRDAARKLADTMTDEQKQQLLEQWTQAAARDEQDHGDRGGDAGQGSLSPPTPQQRPPVTAYEDVDLREADVEDQVIARWFSDTPVEPGAAPRTRGRAAVRRARSAAEQAVEKSIVPSRYHQFIQRYFRQLDRTAETAPSPGPPDTTGNDGDRQ